LVELRGGEPEIILLNKMNYLVNYKETLCANPMYQHAKLATGTPRNRAASTYGVAGDAGPNGVP